MQTRQANLEGSGEIRLRRLVKEALRMRPSRIIVGEVRQEESLDLLIALNSGLAGICTLHANSARGAVTKMRTLPLLAGENRRPRHPSPARAARVPQRTAWRAELGAATGCRSRAGPPGPSSTAPSLLFRGLSEPGG